MARKLAKMVITGSINNPATTRGITRKPTGSRDRVSSASICSEIFMLPISAASEAPNLPASTRDRTMGQSSRMVLLKMTLTVMARESRSEDW
ncbi:MAG: hypothetical protein BWY83_03265 [bacterium ADurb.Bin478]|nr:MAG: hypothetical protein BWY83_03265 [bacterium ADurb.Bin478]